MTNNTTYNTQKNILPTFWFCVSIFLTVLFFVSFFYFKDIHIPIFTTKEFEFSNFLFYNFGLKLIGYLFKFILLSAIFYMGLFLFRRTEINYLDILKTTILAEIIFLFPDLLAYVWFVFFSEAMGTHVVMVFDDNFTLNGLLGFTNESIYYKLLDNFGFFEFFYVAVFANIINNVLDESYSRSFLWVSTTYFSFIITWSLARILITL